jgi:subtilase family serine protease
MSRGSFPVRNHRTLKLRVELLEDRTVPSIFTPAQVRQAYGFDQVTLDGAGQTIAIVDAYDDPNIASDLAAFDTQFGVPDAPSFTKVQMGGSVAPNAGWATEIALDVEWAHAMAPGANILLVEAKSASFADLLAAVDYAASQPLVSAVSMSWGAGEFPGESSYDFHFTTPAGHQGVTFVASSGDTGAVTNWPAVSKNVVGVGGTSLTLNSDSSYNSESGWSGSGGGVSRYVSKPDYQGYVSTGATRRSSPDVSYNANPNTGVYVLDSYNGGWFQVGGTSAGAPQWAGLIAVANEGRVNAGGTTLDGPSQTLYALYRMGQTALTTDFHDVTTGHTRNGRTTLNATAGYDMVTGLGTPKVAAVVAGLVGWTGSAGGGTLGSGGSGAPSGNGGHLDVAVTVSAPTLAPTQTAPVLAPSPPAPPQSTPPQNTPPQNTPPQNTPTTVVVVFIPPTAQRALSPVGQPPVAPVFVQTPTEVTTPTATFSTVTLSTPTTWVLPPREDAGTGWNFLFDLLEHPQDNRPAGDGAPAGTPTGGPAGGGGEKDESGQDESGDGESGESSGD